MPVTTDKAAPYAPASTVLDVISRYRDRGLPTPVTKDVLARAGIAETIIPRVLQALQTLDLVDDAGQPTPTLEGIRRAPAGEYQQRLAEWLNAAYADALNFVDPATADEVAVRDAFRNYNPVGQQARMVSLFIGLYAAAGIGTDKAKTTTQRAPRSTPKATRTASSNTPKPLSFIATARAAAAKTSQMQGMPPALAGLMASLPPSGEGWTKAARDKFFTTFGTVLDFCFPIVANGATDDSEGDEE